MEGIEADQGALEAIARMAMGGMRDAQSILDQMISFCGKMIKPEDVLDVYGLAASNQIRDLGDAILGADYDKILTLTEQFAEMGLDFYRALLDLSEYFRTKLVNSLSGKEDSQEIYPEQITRVLDALQNGESLVKLGLSEKANFQVTIFRAVESARAKSIDQVIRRITQTIPAGAKKKRPKTEVGTPPSSLTKAGAAAHQVFSDREVPDEALKVVTPPEVNVPVIEQTEPDISEELEVFEEPKKKQSDKRNSHAETVTFQGEIASAKDLRNTDPELIKKE